MASIRPPLLGLMRATAAPSWTDTRRPSSSCCSNSSTKPPEQLKRLNNKKKKKLQQQISWLFMVRGREEMSIRVTRSHDRAHKKKKEKNKSHTAPPTLSRNSSRSSRSCTSAVLCPCFICLKANQSTRGHERINSRAQYRIPSQPSLSLSLSLSIVHNRQTNRRSSTTSPVQLQLRLTPYCFFIGL